MSPVKREEMSLYEEAKAGLSSLFWQIAQVFTSLLVIFLFAGGHPAGWLVTTCFIVGIVFVFWRENKRTKDELGEHKQISKGEYESKQFVTLNSSHKQRKPNEVQRKDVAALKSVKLGGGFVVADRVHAHQIGGDIHNHYNYVPNQSPTLTRQEYRNRQALLAKVKNYWIKGVLEKSLHNQVLIELGLEERPDAITNPWSEIIEIGENSPQPLSEGTKVIDVFDQIGTGRTLLILGDPGSGKTTTLLELARNLIDRAEQDTDQLIPVVFNLSSWAKKRQAIADWLVEELNTIYQVPKKIRQAWVKNQQLLPLLDGLDEVKADYRDECILALNRFKKDYGAELVVCSRIKDYEALSNRLNFQKAVYLRVLSLAQIYDYLNLVGADLTGLRTLIEKDKEWKKLANSPLMLNIMTLAYQGVAVEDLPRTEVVEEWRRQLFDAYIEKMFKRRKTNQRYNKAQVKRWLIWMDQRMVEESQTVFLIENMQPYWLVNRKQKQTYRLMVGLMIGLMVGLMSGLILGLILGLVPGLILGLILGLVAGLKEGSKEEIKTVEILQFNWKKILINLLMFGLMFGLMGGLMTGLIGGLIGGLMFGLESSEIQTKTNPNQGIWKSACNAITLLLMVGLMVGLIPGLMAGLTEGLTEGPTEELMAGLMAGRTEGLTEGLMGGLMLGLIFGLIGGMVNGGMASIQHFFLRLVLYFNNCIPWNYARFLDYAADRIFLQKVGGGYIFIHRMLMEHFAEMEPEN
ncbi:NACHT domain-containing protein [Moorena sp. SIO3A2]|uniref:NACHT domain-containing protein n=1 Tax=Moorena sp. SIO3A2 TaxID=2607841 RepID=UPI0013B9E754|nr:NACHT domain-containing protein [Moorena sp. SIO3A2]NER91524.1 NACHT domain-containing protein [Moorena sp. SIO3A2]